MVPGHEIVGRIIATGNHAKKFKTGDLAGVGVMVDSCRECEDCKNHQEIFCSVSPVVTYDSMGKDGLPAYGGYSDTIVVHEDFVLHVSEKLHLAAVAPLLCAGITTYSPLRRWGVKEGHKLAVVGLGGLGHMAVKFGVAFGAKVTVISISPAKKEAAFEQGAHHFLISKDEQEMNDSAILVKVSPPGVMLTMQVPGVGKVSV